MKNSRGIDKNDGERTEGVEDQMESKKKKSGRLSKFEGAGMWEREMVRGVGVG